MLLVTFRRSLRASRVRLWALATLALLAAACGTSGSTGARAPELSDAARMRAIGDRNDHLERETKRLRADLAQAEAALVAVESGVRGAHTRAGAVSTLAEARMRVLRAHEHAPWNSAATDEADQKLVESQRQLEAGHFAAATLFAARALRLAEAVVQQLESIEDDERMRRIRPLAANLRRGPSRSFAVVEVLARSTPVVPAQSSQGWMLVRAPSGNVGWILASLLEER